MCRATRLALTLLLGLAATVASAATWYHLNDAVLFDPGVTGAQGWGEPRGLALTPADGVLRLRVDQPDCYLVRRDLNLDPGMLQWLQVRYRASGFAAPETHGELFYENAAHGFADLNYAHLPSLLTDGQWHDLWVDIPRSLRSEADDWWQNGPVKALRLDLVDEAPGQIELGAIRLTAQRDDLFVPAEGRCLTRWQDPYGLAVKQHEGSLALDITAPDCRLFSADVPLDPAAARFFVLRYRAWGFTVKETGGQIFYANSRHDIAADYRLPVPSLQTDGQWHDLVIDGAQALGRAYGDWQFGGPVRTLRLDLVDQAPGQVELAFVLTTPRLQVSSLAELSTPTGRCWLLPAAAFAPGRACALSLPAGQYSLWQRLLDVPQAYEAARRMKLTGVKAAELAGGNGGTLTWVLLGTCEGGTLSVAREGGTGRPPAGMPAHPGDGRTAADPGDEVLLDAVLIAEGTAAPQDRPVAVTQPVTSTIRPLPSRRLTISRPYWRGDMLACPQAGESDAKLQAVRTLFRRRFEVPAEFTDAWLQISVDDYFRLYLNGEKLAENFTPDSWMKPALVEVTKLLKRGQRNTVAVEAYNVRGAEGVLFDLVINAPDRSVVRVVSDGQWRCAGRAAAGWTAPDFEDSTWVAPTVQPGPPNSPWVVTIPYVSKTWEPPTTLADLTVRPLVRRGESQEFSCRVRSEKPVGAGDVLGATVVRTDTGRTVLQREFTLTAEQCRAEADGSVTIGGLAIPLSRWYPSMPLELQVELYGRALDGGPQRAARFAYENPSRPANLTSEVRATSGLPQLFVDGKPFYAMVGNGAALRGRDTSRIYRAAGFNVAAIWTDHMGAPQWWTGPDEYDFAAVDELVIQQLDADPDSLVLPIVWAAPPPWWGERYPEEIARFSDDTVWTYYKSTPSFSSRRWREDAARALTAYVRHLEQSPYASRVLGYWVIGGVSAEWQGWGCHGSAAANHLMDYSPPARKAFAEFLRQHYPGHPQWAQAGIPDLATRLGRELGVFRDPALAGPSVAYNEFYSESVVDMMLSCVGAAKQATGRRKIAGAYFGYSLEYANMDWCLQMSGHNALHRALASPDIDFLSAPHSYAVRRLGEDMGWMWPSASINRAGKLFWPDDDSRTHLSGPCDYNPTVNPAQTREALRRNFGKELCHLNPVGFLQLESGRELDSPAIARDCRITRRAGEFALRTFGVPRTAGAPPGGARPRAQIAAVIDEESLKYLAYDQGRLASGQLEPVTAWNGDQWLYDRPVNNLAAELIGYQRSRLARIGAPVDIMLLSDFRRAQAEHRPLDYKLYLMLSCLQYDEATRAAVRTQIQDRAATVLWCYAPGLITGNKVHLRNMQALTGFSFARVPGPSTPVVNVTNLRSPLTAGLQALSFGAPYELEPLFGVQDPQAETLGLYRDSGAVALAAKQVGRSRSLFCGSHLLPPDLLRSLARAAGVHVYCDSGDVLDAGGGFVLLHTSTAGEKTLVLPSRADVVDVYEGNVLARDVDRLTIDEAAATTRLLYVGKADEFLQAMDYGSL